MIKLIHSAISVAYKRGLKPKTILIDKKSLAEFDENLKAMPVILFASANPTENEKVEMEKNLSEPSGEVKSKTYNILGDNFEVIEVDTDEFTLTLK